VVVQRVAVRDGALLVATAAPVVAPDPTPRVATASREPGDTECREVTVLFCDLVGATELSTRLDVEDYGEAIRAYHALFGYPQAHEDSAEQAVRAAKGQKDAKPRTDADTVTIQCLPRTVACASASGAFLD
jgi:class 3 adenylate cyclase